MTDKIVVISSCETAEEAQKIARGLVEKRLAACVQVVPQMNSVYHWKGKVEESSEVLLLIKSSRGLFDRLRQEIARMHSYAVPEVIALPVIDGSAGYLDWMDRELKAP